MAKKAKPDPVERYARDVVAGLIVAGPLVRLACQRHLDDLEHGPERGLKWDPDSADKALQFFTFLTLPEDEKKPFKLQPWQEFIIGSLFGWKKASGFRRFRNAYVEVGKGNGKTPMAAGICLYGLIADREAGAEIYSAATTREQASILFRDAKNIAESSPDIAPMLDIGNYNIAHLPSRSFFRAVSSEHKGLDGKRVHMAAIDEVHEHPTPMVVDKMRAGTKGRTQALIFEITNAGYDKDTVCWHHHEYSEKVLKGINTDDSWFAYVCGLDDGDDWKDEAVWLKANPNLGVSVTLDYLREQVREALGMPSKQNIVKRLNFCIWTEQAEKWIEIERWDALAGPADVAALAKELEGHDCFAGLDLASTTDLAALVLVFPGFPREGCFAILSFFWAPEEADRDRERRNRTRYKPWVAQEFLEETEGEVIDYDVIRKRINGLHQVYNIKEIAIDRWNAIQLATQLQGDGFTVIGFGQGFASMAAPTKELEKLVKAGDLVHGSHPVLRWNFSNLSVEQDAAGNLKPSKRRSTEKIDGCVALIMALGRATLSPEADCYVPGSLLN